MTKRAKIKPKSSRHLALGRAKLRAIAGQRKANRSTLSEWERFTSHREQVTQRLLATRPGGRLCLLGAGNCNDVDLAHLTQVFSEVHLVDLDEQAVTSARDRQPAAARKQIVLHGGVDFSGAIEKLPRWKKLAVTEDEMMSHPRAVTENLVRRLRGDFDCVASMCVLSQLQLAVVQELGDSHQLFLAAAVTTNLTHLRVLAELTRSGGHAVFFSEVTSDTLLPLPSEVAGERGLDTLTDVLATGRCITMCEPQRLLHAIEDDPVLRRKISPAKPHAAWLWHQGQHQRFLVYDLCFTRL